MALWKNMLMWRQNLHVMFTFVLILYMRILLEAHAGSDVCSICQCDFGGVLRIHCDHRNLTSVPENILQNVRILKLSDNKISKIERGSFENLPSLKILPYISKMMSQRLGQFEWEMMPHLPYSRNNTLSDYDLFRNLHLDGRYMNSRDEKYVQ
ncbi:uncharacterized protein LOC106877970 [Octopus bimaculoides]|uniref:uncharacterized protein LOC106877970 n=1 Tax=Octopus bimaculoides TaxID=37653 RepID=UPI0022E88F5B|nr:uncharacterized protein LOC106877970 [Octopus bimaculoides]